MSGANYSLRLVVTAAVGVLVLGALWLTRPDVLGTANQMMKSANDKLDLRRLSFAVPQGVTIEEHGAKRLELAAEEWHHFGRFPGILVQNSPTAAEWGEAAAAQLAAGQPNRWCQRRTWRISRLVRGRGTTRA